MLRSDLQRKLRRLSKVCIHAVAVVTLSASAFAADPVPVKPLASDKLLANPADPDRMATGVTMDKIVPRLAMLTLRKDLEQYPDSPRLNYYLGRIYQAGNEIDKAIKALEKAKSFGYRMADYNLAIIYTFDRPDLRKARLHAFAAAKSGIGSRAKQLVDFVTFKTRDYSEPEIFARVYRGSLQERRYDKSRFVNFMGLFLGALRKSGCNADIPIDVIAQVGEHRAAKVFGQLFGALAKSQRDGTIGYDETRGAMMNIAGAEKKAQADAALFLKRYSMGAMCNSPVAKRFIKNAIGYIRGSGPASFKREFEKSK